MSDNSYADCWSVLNVPARVLLTAHCYSVTSGSAFGSNIQPAQADAISKVLVQDPLNADLQWSEGSFRGFFTLELDPQTVTATYYAMENVGAYQF